MAIGTAYQVYDDCLDLFGTEADAGKSLGTDLAKGKLTLPVLLALERLPALAREELKLLLKDWSPQDVPRLRSMLEGIDAGEECRACVHEFLRAARHELTTLPLSESRRALEYLTDYVEHQTGLLNARV
jgi:octaprenyl-diphosphate synthase